MPADPTDADRQRAEAICVDMPGLDFEDEGESWREKVNYVAQALAGERERARAPFLALADMLLNPTDHTSHYRDGLRDAARAIREAAQEQTP